MSKVVVNNTTRTVTVTSTGRRGLPGPKGDKGDKGDVGDVNPATIEAKDAAEGFAALSQKWAEGTKPGGEGTKSAKEHAQDAAGSAALALAATLVEYGINPYNPDGLPAGEWYAERYASFAAAISGFYAENFESDEGGEVSVVMSVDDEPVLGPVVVEYGTPVSLNDLAIAVPVGSRVSFTLTPTPGEVRRVFIKAYGKLS